MPRYRCTVTREVTESAHIEVEADSIEEANEEALYRAQRAGFSADFPALNYVLDECVGGTPYIPDEDYAEEL